MSDINQAVVAMQQCVCSECGIPFYVPRVYFDAKINADEEVICPNGHGNLYETEEHTATTENAALRRQLIQALHRAEQAEARHGGADEPPTPVDELPPDPERCMVNTEGFHCPRCETCSIGPGEMIRHLTEAHGVTTERVAAILAATAEAYGIQIPEPLKVELSKLRGSAAPDAETVTPEGTLRYWKSLRLLGCPRCDATYKTIGRLGRHLCRAHNCDDARAEVVTRAALSLVVEADDRKAA